MNEYRQGFRRTLHNWKSPEDELAELERMRVAHRLLEDSLCSPLLPPVGAIPLSEIEGDTTMPLDILVDAP